jgi:hypothetical protein
MPAKSRQGLANKVLLVIVLLLALAAILGVILTGVQGDVLDAINGSTDDTKDKFDDKKPDLQDQIADAFGMDSDGGTQFTPELTFTGGRIHCSGRCR